MATHVALLRGINLAGKNKVAMADLRTLVAGLGQLIAARHAHPAAAEEMPLLPAEHRGVDVRGPRQHPALPERPERVL